MVSARLAAPVLVGALCVCLGASQHAGPDDSLTLVQQHARHGAASREVEESTLDIDGAMRDMISGMERLVSATADVLQEASTLVQLNEGLQEVASSPVSFIEEESAQAPGPKVPFKEQFSDFKQRTNERVAKVMTGINKGVSTANARLEHSVGNMMSKANSAVDDIHSAASNTLQGVKDFTDAASEPITSKVNTHAALFNSKVKVMIGKINHAIDDMKGGMRDLAHGVTEGMKEASEKIAAQLAQSVHEHVRQEIELARAAEPASLLELDAEEHSGATAMSKAHHAVDAIRASATEAFDGLEELVHVVGNNLSGAHSAHVDSEVDDMLSRTADAIAEMKSSVHEFAHGMTDVLKEASEKIGTEVTRAVNEHMQQELELDRAETA